MVAREQLGPYVLLQSEGCFPLGGDTLALGRFATVRRGWRVCDLGCGTGALGLLLLARADNLQLTGIELNPAAAQLARQGLAENNLTGTVLTGDLREPGHLPPGAFDLMVSNPPWFQTERGRSGGMARSEEACTLLDVCAAARRGLKNGGRFALVHRPERLADVMEGMRTAGIEPKRMQLVQHRPDSHPSAVLLEGVRQGKPGLEILPPQYLHTKAAE